MRRTEQTIFPNMNNNDQPSMGISLQGWAAALAGVVAASLVGCHTTGYRQSDAAAGSSQAASAEILVESRELEATAGALTELVNQPAADARPQFLAFSAALDRLSASARRAGGGVNRMWRNRSSYFEIWDKEIAAISDAEIRKSSQARKAEVSSQFDSVSHQYDEAQDQLASLIHYLQDIRKSLSTDLTRQGLAATQPSARQAGERARQVQNALTQSAAALDTLSARTASFRVQEVK